MSCLKRPLGARSQDSSVLFFPLISFKVHTFAFIMLFLESGDQDLSIGTFLSFKFKVGVIGLHHAFKRCYFQGSLIRRK